jgi:hypothetical protein
VAFSMPWKQAGVENGGPEAGGQDSAASRDRLTAFRAELTRCSAGRPGC